MATPAKSAPPAVILVVDDEPYVVQTVSAILMHAGYAVLRASSPLDALEIAAERQDPIHLFLCDVLMPDLSGTALAEKLRRLHPSARCLFMAGLPDNPDVAGLLSRGQAFLPKPFLARQLVGKVQEVLAAPLRSRHV